MSKKLNEMTREEALLVLEKSGLLPPAEVGVSAGRKKQPKQVSDRRSNGEGSWASLDRKKGTYWKYTLYLGKTSEGKVKTKSFGGYKKSEILKRVNEFRADYMKGKVASDMLFQDYFKDWIYNYKIKEVTNATFDSYLTTYRLRIVDSILGTCKLEDITLQLLQSYFNQLSKAAGDSVVKHTKIKVNNCLNKALMEGLILRNYCKGVVFTKKTVKKKDKALKVLTKEEQELFESGLCLDYLPHQVFYLILYTGLRRGEALGLKWSDINDNKLTIERQVVPCAIRDERGKFIKYQNLIKPPKTANGEREIPLPRKVIELFERIPKQSDFVFVNRKGGLVTPAWINNVFLRYTKALNLEGKTIHSLRHSYATRLFELGEHVKTVQVLLGHANINMTLNIYTHVTSERKAEAATKLDLL